MVDTTVAPDDDLLTRAEWKKRAERLRAQLNNATERHARIIQDKERELAVEQEKVKTALAEMRLAANRAHEAREQLERQQNILRVIHQLTDE